MFRGFSFERKLACLIGSLSLALTLNCQPTGFKGSASKGHPETKGNSPGEADANGNKSNRKAPGEDDTRGQKVGGTRAPGESGATGEPSSNGEPTLGGGLFGYGRHKMSKNGGNSGFSQGNSGNSGYSGTPPANANCGSNKLCVDKKTDSGKPPSETQKGGTPPGNDTPKGGTPPDGKVPPENKVPTEGKLPPGEIPPGKVGLKLKVVQQNHEAWWLNCLSVSINGSPEKIDVGCNKTTPTGKEVLLIGEKPPFCNQIKVTVKTFKNTDNAHCIAERNAGRVCNGPFGAQPDWTRSPSASADLPFYRLYDAKNINAGFDRKYIATNDNLLLMESQATSFSNSNANRWIRAYFEDQPSSNLQLAQNDPNYDPNKETYRENVGVDFNDYIFDIMGEDVKFTVEGSGLSCN